MMMRTAAINTLKESSEGGMYYKMVGSGKKVDAATDVSKTWNR